MREPKRIPGLKYRSCRKCKNEYNVSRFDESGRIYICPKCEKKERMKKNARVMEINSRGVQNAVFKKS